jgi:hypothetical protein
MSKIYWLQFGSGDPSTKTGLTPTLSLFANFGGTLITGPGVTEVPALSGLYQFTYGPTNSIIFKADGGSILADSDRYIVGVLDPIQAVDEKVGTTTDSFGSTAADPTTLYGFAKRNQEFLEGNATFTKSTGIWSVASRGSSTVIATKQLSNTTTLATKT